MGGLARTVDYRGYRFDIGGHLFFSKREDINALWREVLGEAFLSAHACRASTTEVIFSIIRCARSMRCRG